MGTVVEKLQKALDNKAGIKRALDARRFKDVGENQSTWENEIYAIEPPLETLTISDNGEHDVKDYKKVNVGIVAQGDEPLINLIEGDITELTIPYGTTIIRNNAFQVLQSLKKITIPDSVKSIGVNAFQNCSKLEEVTIPDSVITIGVNTFQSCSNLKKAILPKNIETLSNNLFSSCISLTEVTIPNNVKIIGDSVFKSCSLTEIIIPNNVTSIGSQGFSANKFKEITIPDSVTNLGDSCFNKCSILKKAILNCNVITLPYGLFENCSSLEEVTIPDSVTTIENNVFQNCTNLTNLVIPSGVTEIGSYSLRCGSSTNKSIIIMESETPPTISSNTISKTNTKRIFVKQGCRTKFISATNWSSLADIIVERNNVIVNIPSALLNNENYTYSLDNGVTYSQFTNSTLALQDVATIKMKSTTADTTILIGTTAGGNDVGTIANSELTFSFSGDNTIYLTIQ